VFCAQCGSPLVPGATFCSNCGARVVVTLPDDPAAPAASAAPATPATQETAWAAAAAVTPAVRYGGFWRRFWAVVLDGLIVNVVTVPVGMMLSLPTATLIDSDNITAEQMVAYLSAYAMAAFIGTVVNWLYFALMESSKWQATLGKLALGLRVTGLAGRRIGFGRASGRFFAKMVSALTLGIGYVIQVFTARRQALHDLIAGTLIVRTDH
jgi:uncharacterized RDD family membrane protein YckC